MAGPTELFDADPEDTRAAIMKATYDALRKHGYADLTISRIGDEFDKSKSLLYHHYESKDALLIDFLAFMLERMAEEVPIDEYAQANEQILEGFDHVILDLLDERDQYMRAMTELRAQAAHDERFRKQFTENDRYIREIIADIIDVGIEQGEFRDVDADRVASMLVTVLDGILFRQTTTESADVDAVREEFRGYIERRLLPAE